MDPSQTLMSSRQDRLLATSTREELMNAGGKPSLDDKTILMGIYGLLIHSLTLQKWV